MLFQRCHVERGSNDVDDFKILEHVANGLFAYTRKKRELSKLVGKHMYSEDISQFQVDQRVRTNGADLFGLWKACKPRTSLSVII